MEKGKRLGGEWGGGGGRFPAAAVAVAAYMVWVWVADMGRDGRFSPLWVAAFAGLTGAGLSVALGLLGKTFGWKSRWRLAGQGAALATWAVCAWMWRTELADEYFWVSRGFGTLAVWAVAGWALSLVQARREDAAPRIAVAIVAGGAAALAVAIGGGAVAWALRELFGVNHQVMNHVGRFLMGFAPAVGVWVVLSHATRDEPFEMPKVWRLLLKGVGVPVYLAYLGVLLAYFLTWAARWELPNGTIGEYATWAALGWMGLRALLAEENGRWTAGFARWGGLAVLPLTALQFAALGIRIGEYGLTPARYGGLAFAAFAAAMELGAAWRRDWAPRWGWWVAAGFALWVGVSPWDAVDAGVEAQSRKLEAFRARAAAGETFDMETKWAVMDEWDYMRAWVKTDGHWRKRWTRKNHVPGNFEKEWGFAYQSQWERRKGVPPQVEKTLVATGKYRYRLPLGQKVEIPPGSATIEIWELAWDLNGRLVLAPRGMSCEKMEEMSEILLAVFNEDGSAKESSSTIILSDGRTAVFTSLDLGVEIFEDGTKSIRTGEGTAWVFGAAVTGD